MAEIKKTKRGVQILGIVLGLMVVSAAPFAWGADVNGTGVVTVGTTPTTLTFQTSPSVYIEYDTNDGTASVFTIGSVNDKGTRIYAVDSDFTGMFQQVTSNDNTPGIPAPTTNGDTGEFASGWTVVGG